MNLPILHLIPLAVGVSWAIVCDVRRRRIPNAVSALVLAGGLGTQLFHNGWLAGLSGLAAATLMILVLYKPWSSGGIGGGDVKLAAATASWIGLSHLIWFALAAAVTGGIVAAVCYVLAPPAVKADVRANLVLAAYGDLPPGAASHRKTRVSVPYAVAIGGGAAVALLFA